MKKLALRIESLAVQSFATGDAVLLVLLVGALAGLASVGVWAWLDAQWRGDRP